MNLCRIYTVSLSASILKEIVGLDSPHGMSRAVLWSKFSSCFKKTFKSWETPPKIKHGGVFREIHKKTKKNHMHLLYQATLPHKWKRLKETLRAEAKLASHFSSSHITYPSALAYLTDPQLINSAKKKVDCDSSPYLTKNHPKYETLRASQKRTAAATDAHSKKAKTKREAETKTQTLDTPTGEEPAEHLQSKLSKKMKVPRFFVDFAGF